MTTKHTPATVLHDLKMLYANALMGERNSLNSEVKATHGAYAEKLSAVLRFIGE